MFSIVLLQHNKTLEYHISRLSVNSLLGHINMNDGWIVTTYKEDYYVTQIDQFCRKEWFTEVFSSRYLLR